MAFKGTPKAEGSGRKKGTPNKRTQDLIERCEALKCDPFEILINFAKGDWQALGYVSGERVKHVTESGQEILEDTISAELRMQSAKEACQYLYPKRKTMEVSGELTNPYADKSLEELRALAKETLKEDE